MNNETLGRVCDMVWKNAKVHSACERAIADIAVVKFYHNNSEEDISVLRSAERILSRIKSENTDRQAYGAFKNRDES